MPNSGVCLPLMIYQLEVNWECDMSRKTLQNNNSLPTAVSCSEVHERQAPQGVSKMWIKKQNNINIFYY